MKVFYPSYLDVTPIVVSVTEGMTSGGAPNVIATYDGYCTFSEKLKTIRGKDGEYLELIATCSIGCDIAPSAKKISGSAVINSVTYKVHSAKRLRNSDGTINHTELELI